MADFPSRPQYHLTCPNWMNDPIPFWFAGSWHVFFQHNPHAPKWDRMHWGHAVSKDLFHWESLPIALGPSEPYDIGGGIWTGSIVEDRGRFYAFYTGVGDLDSGRQVQCVAVSDDLLHWRKHFQNPILLDPPPGFGPCWRDPHVWKEGETWKMLVGSERIGVGGALLLYESRDLLHWQFVCVSLEGVQQETGHDFECPDLFPLDGRWVLLTSRGATHWQIGEWDGMRFHPERRGTIDGPAYDPVNPDATPLYAAKTAVDGSGNRLLFAWLRETEDLVGRTWSGAQALPRELKILADGSLGVVPARQLNRARSDHKRGDVLRVPPRERRVLNGWCGAWCEFAFRVSGDDSFTLILRANEHGVGSEFVYDASARTFDGIVLGPGEVRLNGFIDGSILEIFVNDRATTRRTYVNDDQDCAFVAAAERTVVVNWIHSWRPGE